MKINFVNFGRENLGIEYLSSMLKMSGFEVTLTNDPGLFSREDNVFCLPFFEKLFERKKKIIEKIVKSKPQIVAFSIYTSNYIWACDMAVEIKKRLNTKIVFGGMHSTLLPEKVIKHDFVDFVIIGEGEYAFLELVKAIDNNSSLARVGNLCYKIRGKIIKNDLSPPIENLDALPLPDKELFKNDVRFQDDYMIMTSRGCPYSCSFCCESYLNKLYKNKYFRRRSVAPIIEELEIMKQRYGFKEVMFFDAVLFTDKKWLKNLITQYKKKINVPFRCCGHVNFFDYEVGKLLKDGGCYCIDFGIQTFNQEIKRKFLNRFESNEQIRKTLNICDDLKIKYDVDIMLGLPGSTQQDYELPLKFLKNNKYLNRLKCYYLAYYPKLSIIDKVKKIGLLDDSDIQDIEMGKIGDWFYRDSIKGKKHKRWKENFTRFYKIYPIIPKFLRDILLYKKLYRWLYLVPSFIIVLLQLVIGIKKKDYRFKIYINNYLYNFMRIRIKS